MAEALSTYPKSRLITRNKSRSRSYIEHRSDCALLALSEFSNIKSNFISAVVSFVFSSRPISAHYVSMRALREVLNNLN